MTMMDRLRDEGYMIAAYGYPVQTTMCQDLRGYRLYHFVYGGRGDRNLPDVHRVACGCRFFTIPDAIEHWADPDHPAPHSARILLASVRSLAFTLPPQGEQKPWPMGHWVEREPGVEQPYEANMRLVLGRIGHRYVMWGVQP